MRLVVQKMCREFAEDILGWQYPPPFDMYSLEFSPAAMAELLGGDYFAVCDQEGLIGYICAGEGAQVPGGDRFYGTDALDIGLGLRPCLCGQGLGQELLRTGLDFFGKRFGSSRFRLTVASFNARAIKVYERAGFWCVGEFVSTTRSKPQTFKVLVKEGENHYGRRKTS